MNRLASHLLARIFCLLLATAALSLSASAADVAILKNGFTIRHERRLVVGENTRLFFGTDDSSFVDVPTADIESFEKDLSPPPPRPAGPAVAQEKVAPRATEADLAEVVNSASAAYHLDPDLVNSVIHAESGFNSRAVSKKGAQGLMQLMPGTANDLGVNDAFDPQENVDGGSRYLRQLLEQYNFDLVKALAAYNAGPHRVEQYHGVPPYRDTRAYVSKIVRDYNRKKDAEEKQASQTHPKKTTKTQASTPGSAAAAR